MISKLLSLINYFPEKPRVWWELTIKRFFSFLSSQNIIFWIMLGLNEGQPDAVTCKWEASSKNIYIFDKMPNAEKWNIKINGREAHSNCNTSSAGLLSWVKKRDLLSTRIFSYCPSLSHWSSHTCWSTLPHPRSTSFLWSTLQNSQSQLMFLYILKCFPCWRL